MVHSALGTEIYSCFCMSLYVKDSSITVVGASMYTCHHSGYNLVPSAASELSDYMCGRGGLMSNREGQLRGRCSEGFVPPAYSYDRQCVRCTHDDFLKNLLKYGFVAFLPLTFFCHSDNPSH